MSTFYADTDTGSGACLADGLMCLLCACVLITFRLAIRGGDLWFEKCQRVGLLLVFSSLTACQSLVSENKRVGVVGYWVSLRDLHSADYVVEQCSLTGSGIVSND